jgi:acetylornithine/succinyldiaminopimelate/putrescine aminotransferase
MALSYWPNRCKINLFGVFDYMMAFKWPTVVHPSDKIASQGTSMFAITLILFASLFLTPAGTTANSAGVCTTAVVEASERVDFRSEWGVKLIPDSDPAWSDPAYIKELIAFAAPSITNFGGRAWIVLDRFTKALSHFGPGEVAEFTTTGTAANNALFDYAALAYEIRTGKKTNHANLLSFAKPYGGIHGRIGNYHHVVPKDMAIPTPMVFPNKTYSKEEILELEKQESQALDFIREQVANPALEIGGIFIEPIAIASGLFMYRTEFMLKLRKLADELRVPIFADEILTGGGRTRRFWAYQHYKGFTPDLVTFGKGLVVNGVFIPYRNSGFHFYATRGTTTATNPLALIQATQVIETIRKRNLLRNVKDVGNYFYQKLQAEIKLPSYAREVDRPRGIGLLLWAPYYYDQIEYSKYNPGYGPRMLPPLTLTKDQVDYLFKRQNPPSQSLAPTREQIDNLLEKAKFALPKVSPAGPAR